MRCEACNSVVVQGAAFCPRCGAPLGAAQAPPPEPAGDWQAGWAAQPPPPPPPPPFAGAAPQQGWGAPPPAWGAAGYGPPPTNGLAIASLITGIAGIVMCLGPLGSIPALITGYKARREIDATGGVQEGRSMAMAGIVLGWVGVALFTIILIGGILLVIFGEPSDNSGGY